MSQEYSSGVKKWIPKNLKKGALRKSLHTKAGQKIPVAKLEKAAKKSGVTGKRARLAIAFRHMHH